MSKLRIVEYESRHAGAFHDLNLDWISEYFELEALDRQQLCDPGGQILAPGGAILMAERGGVAVGCCALVKHAPGAYEVSKMAVDRRLRGQGIGRILLAEVIRRARGLGARKLVIVSNTRLAPAIHLYRELGFVEVPLESCEYARGNIALELPLGDSPVSF